MANKYSYFKIIQGKYDEMNGWEDEDCFVCNASGVMKREDRESLRENLKAYRESRSGGIYRVISRKELNKIS